MNLDPAPLFRQYPQTSLCTITNRYFTLSYSIFMCQTIIFKRIRHFVKTLNFLVQIDNQLLRL